MRGKPRSGVGGDADVVLVRGRDALQNVDESLGFHMPVWEQPEGRRVSPELPGDSESVSLNSDGYAIRSDARRRSFCSSLRLYGVSERKFSRLACQP